ncbi:MAG: TolC family protein [Nitrospirae bacterium]|nr:TolC family protein [Nitrospirota bacterium]
MSLRLFFISLLVWVSLFQTEILFASDTLTLRAALELNLKNSSKRAIGKQKIIEKQALRLEKRSAFLPKLSFNLLERRGETNLKAQGITFPGAPDKIGPFSTFDARLSFNETLLNLNSLNQLYAADEESRASEIELSQTESELLYQTAILYLNSKKAESSLSADQANVQLSEELLKFAEHEKESGVSTILDVTRAMVKLSEDRQKLVSAVTQKEDAFLTLQNQLGIPLGEMLTLDNRPLPETSFPNIQESLQIALSRRKELAFQSQKEKVKEIQLKAASKEKYPSINLFADYGETGNGISDSFPT